MGILVCDKVYLYDYNINKDDDNQSFFVIDFTKDNPDGIKFVELFSKNSFNKQNIKAFIKNRNQEESDIKAIQQKVTTDFIHEILKEHLGSTYSPETIQKALEKIVITVGQKVPKQQAPIPLPVAAIKPKKAHTQFLVDGAPYPNMKIGEIANTILRERLSQGISDQELINLQKKEYSKQFLDINYPLLSKNRYIDGYPRYYATQIVVNGELFYLCQEWYECSRQYLLEWLKDHE